MSVLAGIPNTSQLTPFLQFLPIFFRILFTILYLFISLNFRFAWSNGMGLQHSKPSQITWICVYCSWLKIKCIGFKFFKTMNDKLGLTDFLFKCSNISWSKVHLQCETVEFGKEAICLSLSLEGVLFRLYSSCFLVPIGKTFVQKKLIPKCWVGIFLVQKFLMRNYHIIICP